MGRVYPLVASNKTRRHNGEGRPSPSRPINSNRCDEEGFPLLVMWIPLHLVSAREGWSSSLVGNQTCLVGGWGVGRVLMRREDPSLHRNGWKQRGKG